MNSRNCAAPLQPPPCLRTEREWPDLQPSRVSSQERHDDHDEVYAQYEPYRFGEPIAPVRAAPWLYLDPIERLLCGDDRDGYDCLDEQCDEQHNETVGPLEKYRVPRTAKVPYSRGTFATFQLLHRVEFYYSG
eukprot:scaffold46385_cov91-Cyclotella_meneghiniana.AAC.1